MADPAAAESITTPTQPPNPNPPSSSSRRPSPPVRDDCWSPEATATLIQAWGQRYVDLKHGNLRQKHWQEVADIVNARHGHSFRKGRPRTDVQCKNRIDTLKKKYKVEKARVLESNGSFVSDWPFFAPLDALIGSSSTSTANANANASATPILMKKQSSSSASSLLHTPLNTPPVGVPLFQPRKFPTPPPPSSSAAPMAATMLPQKRPSSSSVLVPSAANDSSSTSFFKKNYSAVAAAAAAAEAAGDETEDDDEEDDDDDGDGQEESRSSGEMTENDGLRKLAVSIERFSEVYARVEAEKQRQMVELEKQRMQFAKELECQRMQMLVEMQVQLEKVKRAKTSNSNAQAMIYEAVLPFFLADMYG